ncbi:MAG: ribokinase, partial [Lentisphaerae bacterium]|nr:ribokinase [Lentisphaerota bacterium]
MRVLNFGSINIDHVYAVDHFVRPGETIASSAYQVFAGGKGFNQTVALARAGATVA